MNLFENLQLLNENNKLDISNIIYKERKDDKVVDEEQPAYIVHFYADDKYFGEASVCFNPDSDRQFLYNVEVFDEYRGQGLANIIVQYMIDKYNVSELYVDKDNNIAINLYKKFGFEIIDEIENQYIMQRNQ